MKREHESCRESSSEKSSDPVRHPNRIKDLTGQKFGRLTVIRHIYVQKRPYSRWLCKCDCGNEVIVLTADLNRGHSRSCGCATRERLIERNTVHGCSKESLYNVWKDMRQRCCNKNSTYYNRYGGRGIKICEEWNDYKKFREWALNNGYAENLTLDRIDVNGDYCPENCRWADWEMQQNNRTSNHRITVNGETHTIAEWARINGINPGTIMSRIGYGWSEEDAVTEPRRIDDSGKWIVKKRNPERDERGRWKADRKTLLF